MASSPYIDIPFGPFLPDFGGMPNPEIPGYLTNCTGVRSTPNGYRGMPAFADVTSATVASASTAFGHGAAYYKDSLIAFFFVNDAGTIAESRAEGTDTWQDVTPAAGAAVVAHGDFLRFGDDVVFVGQTRAPIKKSLGSAHATKFTDLGGTPPTALYGARVRQHVVLGGLVGTDIYGIRTSAIDDHEDWPTAGTADARAKQSIYESLNPEFGPVRRVIGGEKIGIIFQDSALTRMTYVGGSNVYEFDTFERVEGIGHVNYVQRPVTDGRFWYWYNDFGVFATDGYEARSISDGKLDEALFNSLLSHPIGQSIVPSFTAAYDPKRALVIFGANTNSNPSADRIELCYNAVDGNFTVINNPVGLAYFSGYNASPGTGRKVYNINASTRKLQRFDGATGLLSMQTGYMELAPGRRVQITGAHLLGNNVPGSLTLSYKSTSSLASTDLSESGFTALAAASRGIKSTGRANDQFFSFRVTGTGAENQLIRGIRIYYEVSGPTE